jgi:hypothetical protein
MCHVPTVRESSNSAGSVWKARNLYNVLIAEESLRQTPGILKKWSSGLATISQTDSRHQPLVVFQKGGGAMMKIGDKFKDKITG